MLSGLCAEAMAVPMSKYPRTALSALDDVFTGPIIERDIDFQSISGVESFLEEDQANLVTSGIDFDDAIGEEAFLVDGKEPSGSLSVPEPLPVTAIALGFGCLGILAVYSRYRNHRKSTRRRRVVRIRPLTVLR